jgi:hypothetical protein
LSETRSSFPTATCEVVWSERSGNRVLVVIVVAHDGAKDYFHQVCCVLESDVWIPWSEGPAPGPLALDDAELVVSRIDPLEPGTDAVEVDYRDASRIVDPTGELLIQTAWGIPADGHWSWPEIFRIRVRGNWYAAALPDLPVTGHYLALVYERYERLKQDKDWWAWLAVTESVDSLPSRILPVVLDALRTAHTPLTLYSIAAGPLESLVANNLAQVIDELESAASQSDLIRNAIGSIWVSVSDDVLARRLLSVVGSAPEL